MVYPNDSPSHDAELMRHLAQGDTEALAILYERHANFVKTLLFSYVQRSEVDDLCQEIFLLLAQTARRYKDTGTFRGWLSSLAIGKARNIRRKYWIRNALLLRFGHSETSTKPRVDQQFDAKQLLDRALQQLPSAQRQVLLLHTLQNLDGEEIASILGISVNTVWTRLHRARTQLRQILQEASAVSGFEEKTS